MQNILKTNIKNKRYSHFSVIPVLLACLLIATTSKGQYSQSARALSSKYQLFLPVYPDFETKTIYDTLIWKVYEAAGVPNIGINTGQINQPGVYSIISLLTATDRAIIYNVAFLDEVCQQAGTQNVVYSIAAHELAHHFYNHPLYIRYDKQEEERQADFFSGYMMRRMRLPLDDAMAAIRILAEDSGSLTHPPKHIRMADVTRGYIYAAESIFGDSSYRIPTHVEPAPPPPMVAINENEIVTVAQQRSLMREEITMAPNEKNKRNKGALKLRITDTTSFILHGAVTIYILPDGNVLNSEYSSISQLKKPDKKEFKTMFSIIKEGQTINYYIDETMLVWEQAPWQQTPEAVGKKMITPKTDNQ